MPYFQITETLTECTQGDALSGSYPFAAVLNTEEYRNVKETLQMGIDIFIDLGKIHETKAIVNYDSLTGTIDVPAVSARTETNCRLAFALDERGIVLIDDDDYTLRIINTIRSSRHWRFPSLERFIYDFIEETIINDIPFLDKTEKELERIEELIMDGMIEQYPLKLNDIRSTLLELHKHYEHLIDLALEMNENENNFFKEENLRYFRLISERCSRLQDTVDELREYIIQLRDLVSEQLAIKQNKIMTLLTIITTIFMPLTLIAGWYGMNFVHMPELYWEYGYPVVIISSVLIVTLSLYYFRRKNWL